MIEEAQSQSEALTVGASGQNFALTVNAFSQSEALTIEVEGTDVIEEILQGVKMQDNINKL